MRFPFHVMQFLSPPSQNVQGNPFNTAQTFCDLKALYEYEINSPGLTKHSSSSYSNSNPSTLGPPPRRIKTGPANEYSEPLNAIEQYVFNEPLISLFSNTRIRISSLDQRSTEDLAYTYKLRYTLKDMKRKCDINLQVVLEDLKILYSSQQAENIKILLTCMTQLAAAYTYSSLAELKNGKCKHILEKLNEIEQMVYKYLQSISTQTKNAIPSQDNEEAELTLTRGNSNPGNLGYTGGNLGFAGNLGLGGDPQRLLIPLPVGGDRANNKLQYMTPKNTKKAERVLKDKLSHKEALKILARMKYVIAQWGRLLHYESIANSAMKGMEKEEAINKNNNKKDKFLSPFKKEERKYFASINEDLNEEAIVLKKNQLHKFWAWKIFKWKSSEPITAQEKKSIYQVLCPICEKTVKVDHGKQHLELCKEKAELNNHLCDLDNKLGDVVFQAFKNMKTIQKSLVVDSKKYSKLYSELNNKTPSSRNLEVSNVIAEEASNPTGLLISKSRSEETKHGKSIRKQSQDTGNEPQLETEEENALQGNIDNPETFEDHPLSLSTDKVFTIDNNQEADPCDEERQICKRLNASTTFEKPSEKEKSPKNRRLSAQSNTHSDGNSDNISGLSALILPGNGFDSPAASDSFSLGTPELDRRHSSKTTRCKSLAGDLNGEFFHKKSRFFTVKEPPRDHNTSIQEHDAEEEIVPQSGGSLDKPPMFRKSRTVTKKLDGEETPILKRESRLLNGQAIVECLKEMKVKISQKKLKMKIYELIQKKGKVMLNQQPYHKEMEFLKEEITTSIEELIEKTQCQEIRAVAEAFIETLEKRIEYGRLLHKAEKKLFKLEGKPKKRDSIKLEPLIRHKSGLPPDTHKLFKGNSGDTAGRKFTSVKSGMSLKIIPPSEDFHTNNHPLLIQSTVSDGKAAQNNLGHYLFSFKDEGGSNSKQSFHDIEDTVGAVHGSIDLMGSSFLGLSLSEMQELRSYEPEISTGNTCLSQILNEDMKKSSLKNTEMFGNTNTQPSIVVNDMPLSSILKVRQKAITLSPSVNQELQFDKRNNQRSLTASNQLKSFTGNGMNAAGDAVELSSLSFNESSIILDCHSPNIPIGKVGFHEREAALSREVSLAQPEEIKEEQKGSFWDNPHTLEAIDRHLATVQEDEEEKKFPKKAGPMVKFSQYLTQKTISSKNLDTSDSGAESISSIDSTINDRGYFSDSEARNPNRSLQSHTSVRIEDFEPIKMISKGAFGRVWLVRKKATKDVYAMKVINLAEKLMKNKDLENLRKESNVFSIAQEEFLVRAVFTFTHETCICFVMEYMLGGDLADLLCNYGALEEDVARFYIAELIQAVEYLHSVGIVHRDLKPDNILLDKSGHSKLTDFGLSEVGLSQKIKRVSSSLKPLPITNFLNLRSVMARQLEDLVAEKGIPDELPDLRVHATSHENKEEGGQKETFSRLSSNEKRRKVNRLIGTPDYMAPEIINNVTITSPSSDWWSVGVILFELIVGIPPFNDDCPDKIFQNILGMKIPWDDIPIGYAEGHMTPEAEDLIKKLLNPDHLQRLGANGAREIKEHPFFKSTNWTGIRSQKAPVTFEHIAETDTQQFVRMQDKITAKESHDPFALIHKDGDIEINTQTAKQFLQTSQEKFRMVNISALYSAGLKLTEETMKEKAKELNQSNPNRPGSRKFIDVFDSPE